MRKQPCSHFSTPIIGDISMLCDNRDKVTRIEAKVGDRLQDRDELEAYNKEMRGYLK